METEAFEFVAVKEEKCEDSEVDEPQTLQEFEFVAVKQEKDEDSEVEEPDTSQMPDSTDGVSPSTQFLLTTLENCSIPREEAHSSDLRMGRTDTDCYEVELCASSLSEDSKDTWRGCTSRQGEVSSHMLKCSLCLKLFSSKYSLTNHVFTHMDGIEAPSHICRLCGDVFHSAECLNEHSASTNNCFGVLSIPTINKMKQCARKSYCCDVCCKFFTKVSSLNIHKRSHTGEKPYRCEVCGTFFTQVSNLNVHKRTHTGEKPYRCEICGTFFTQVSSLNIHKRIHTGEKPYECDDCGISFTRGSSLNAHKRTHTGEKPYKCDVCGTYFTRGSSLTAHKRTHTGEKPYKCDVCGISFSHRNSLTVHKRTHLRTSRTGAKFVANILFKSAA